MKQLMGRNRAHLPVVAGLLQHGPDFGDLVRQRAAVEDADPLDLLEGLHELLLVHGAGLHVRRACEE